MTASRTATPQNEEIEHLPDPRLLEEVTSRIVAATDPIRIVLFGSAARGEMTANSDLDLLVVVPDGSRCRDIAKRLYRKLRGVGRAKDIVVLQERDVELGRDNPFALVHTAIAEGRELYRAAL